MENDMDEIVFKKFCENAGITESQLKDKETAKFIYAFLKKNGANDLKEIKTQKPPPSAAHKILLPLPPPPPPLRPKISSKFKNYQEIFAQAGLSKEDFKDEKSREYLADLIKQYITPLIKPPNPLSKNDIKTQRAVSEMPVPVPVPRKSLSSPMKNYSGIDDYTFGRPMNQQDLAFSDAAMGFERPHMTNKPTVKNSEGYVWIPTDIGSCSTLVKRAVLVGYEGKDPVYLGRVHQESEILPCKVVPSKNYACINTTLRVKPVARFEMYCKNTPTLEWIKCDKGRAPSNAVPTGKTSKGEVLYVGRAKAPDGSIQMGQVQNSDGCCYVIDNDNVLALEEYEVMVLQEV